MVYSVTVQEWKKQTSGTLSPGLTTLLSIFSYLSVHAKVILFHGEPILPFIVEGIGMT